MQISLTLNGKKITEEIAADLLLIDFVTKSTTRPDSKVLKTKYPAILPYVMKTTQSRKVKVSVQPL